MRILVVAALNNDAGSIILMETNAESCALRRVDTANAGRYRQKQLPFRLFHSLKNYSSPEITPFSSSCMLLAAGFFGSPGVCGAGGAAAAA